MRFIVNDNTSGSNSEGEQLTLLVDKIAREKLLQVRGDRIEDIITKGFWNN